MKQGLGAGYSVCPILGDLYFCDQPWIYEYLISISAEMGGPHNIDELFRLIE